LIGKAIIIYCSNAIFFADYFNDFNVAGKTVTWTTTLSAFLPYTTVDEYETLDGDINDTTTNWTWINNLNFSVWKGIGVGLGWGLRSAEFESNNTQTYTNIGLSYKI